MVWGELSFELLELLPKEFETTEERLEEVWELEVEEVTEEGIEEAAEDGFEPLIWSISKFSKWRFVKELILLMPWGLVVSLKLFVNEFLFLSAYFDSKLR